LRAFAATAVLSLRAAAALDPAGSCGIGRSSTLPISWRLRGDCLWFRLLLMVYR